MRLEQLQYVVTIARNGSISGAARELRPRRMLNGSADIALCGGSTAQQHAVAERAKQLGLEQENLVRWPLVAFLPASHPLASAESLSVEELEGTVKITFLDADTDEDVPGDGVYAFSDRGSIKDAVAHGKGWALLPISMALDDIYCECGRIRAVQLRETGYAELTLIHRKSRTLTQEETAILEMIRDHIRKMDVRLERMFRAYKKYSPPGDIGLSY